MAAVQGGITLLMLSNRLMMFGYEQGSNTLLREMWRAEQL
jgi:hypothetical protein